MRIHPALLVLFVLLLAAGCPDEKKEEAAGNFDPSEPLPRDNPLCKYDKVWLGMSDTELSQIYNAPEGKGDGFTRVLASYGSVSYHIIDFEVQPQQPERRLILRFYRNQLCYVVDRRNGVTAGQTEGWLKQCVSVYGDDYRNVIPTVQWSWGNRNGLILTFTRDNNSDEWQSAFVALRHVPTDKAADAYLEWWKTENPAEAAAAAPIPIIPDSGTDVGSGDSSGSGGLDGGTPGAGL